MLKELTKVIDYIDNHLTDDIDLDKMSDYTLRKVFLAISNISLSEYIKYRRLSKANEDLLKGEKVTDVAYKYRYESIDGFTRAFKKWTGYLPSEVSKHNITKTFSKITFVINVEGGQSMNYKIIDLPAFTFAGVSKRVPMQFEGVNNAIVELAQSMTQDQTNKMKSLMNLEPKQIVNISYDHDENFLKDEGYLTHMIGVLTTEKNISDNLDKLDIPNATWAVFICEGEFPSTLQNTYADIYAKWLPTSDYKLLSLPNFSFTIQDQHNENYAYSEVWIPVKHKSK